LGQYICMTEHAILTKDLLYREYVELGKTQKEIGDMIGVSGSLVGTWRQKYKIPARSVGRKKAEINGKTFGQLVVVEEVEGCDKRHPAWKCLCQCGKTCRTYASDLLSGRKTSCNECAYKRVGDALWKGHGEISKHFWSQVKNAAKLRDMNLDITIEQAWDKFLLQDRRCVLTGVNLAFHRNDNSKVTASLDRIDSAKGYTVDNTQWVHKIINRMKTDLKQPLFIEWCRKVVKN